MFTAALATVFSGTFLFYILLLLVVSAAGYYVYSRISERYNCVDKECEADQELTRTGVKSVDETENSVAVKWAEKTANSIKSSLEYLQHLRTELQTVKQWPDEHEKRYKLVETETTTYLTELSTDPLKAYRTWRDRNFRSTSYRIPVHLGAWTIAWGEERVQARIRLLTLDASTRLFLQEVERCIDLAGLKQQTPPPSGGSSTSSP